MTPLRRRMREDRPLRGLAPKTQQCSVAAVHQLAQHDRRAPDRSSEEELRQYFLFLLNEKTVAESTFRIHLDGLRFFYAFTLKRPWPVFDLILPRKSQKLPVVLSPQEVRRLLAFPTARLCLQRIYAGGLRLREGTQLQVSDIDPHRLLVRVRPGQGGQDRVVPLAPRLLELLRAYWQRQRPRPGVFPARHRPAPCPPLPSKRRAKRWYATMGWPTRPPFIRCGTRMRPICWNGGYRCGSCRHGSATRAPARPPAPPI